MKRFHVHLGVPDLQASIEFYSKLFGAEPAVRKDDYAKWMLDDPRVNFAISDRGAHNGLNHLGLQADSAAELADIGLQFANADASTTVAETNAHCCYAVSDKHWVQDPQGIPWEAFHSLDSIPVFGVEAPHEARVAGAGGCGSTLSTQPATSTTSAAQSGCCAPAVSERTTNSPEIRAGCCS
jgi:catechol 2,3-dioxygenase-like lactoylglutathione lyase family enzyme